MCLRLASVWVEKCTLCEVSFENEGWSWPGDGGTGLLNREVKRRASGLRSEISETRISGEVGNSIGPKELGPRGRFLGLAVAEALCTEILPRLSGLCILF